MSPTSKNTDASDKNYVVALNTNECEKHFSSVGSKFSLLFDTKKNKKHETEVLSMYENKTYRSKM